MPSIVVTDGARTVTVEEAPDARPAAPVGMDVLPAVDGSLVVYERVGALREVPVVGRVKTKAEAETLEAFIAERAELYLTERDSTVTGGWKIKTEPAPSMRRKDGDSADWIVDLRLWRMP